MATVGVVSPRGKSLLFVIPAYRRVDIAAVCYRQISHLCNTLQEAGLDARAVVIADDDNLAAAAAAGLATIEHENWLGAKLNVGYSYAADNGFDYACAVGSDSWLHPDRFSWLPDSESLLCTRNYSCVSPDGLRQGWFRYSVDGGTGSRVIPLAWLKGCDYKPVAPTQMSGCDTATLLTICRGVTRAPHLIYTDLHPYEVVGFNSDIQVTPYHHLEHHFLVEWQQPFADLADFYPAGLVADIAAVYAAPVPA